MSAIFCTICNLPKTDHTPEMTANCAVFNLSPISAAAVPRISEAETAPAPESDPPVAPGVGASISVASVLLGWCNDIKRELEEFADDGPVGPMVPYRPDADTTRQELVRLERSLSQLIIPLHQMLCDVQVALLERV